MLALSQMFTLRETPSQMVIRNETPTSVSNHINMSLIPLPSLASGAFINNPPNHLNPRGQGSPILSQEMSTQLLPGTPRPP